MNKRNFLLILLVALAGGSVPPFAKLALQDLEPFTLVFLRFVAASFVIYFFLPRKELSFATFRSLKWVALVGALNPIFIFLAIDHLPSNIIGLLFAVVPGLSVVYLWVSRKKRESPIQLTGFALGLVGVGIISLETATTNTTGDTWLGLMFASVAVLGFFAYGIMSKEKQRKQGVSGAALAFYFMITTTLLAAPMALYESLTNPWVDTVQTSSILSILYLGFLATGAQYILYQVALKRMEAAQANIFIYMQPLISIALAAVLVGEQVTALLAIGGAITLVGARLALSNKTNS